MTYLIRTAATLVLAVSLLLGVAPSSVTPAQLEPEPAEAIEWACVSATASWLTIWMPTSRVIKLGAAATGIYGFYCPTNKSSYPHGRCIEWKGPRSRCSLYEDGYQRFGANRYNHDHAWN